MADFQESEPKQAIRLLLKDAAGRLQRPGLTYLGMPAEEALDILTLKSHLKNVICIADDEGTLNETRRRIASLPLKERRYVQSDIWVYLRDDYLKQEMVADVTFLDFYGGGINKSNPFANEIAGLRNYFSKQASRPNQAFVLAWTYMPRDKGAQPYHDAFAVLRPSDEDLAHLRGATGLRLRSLAIRLLIKQSLQEHGMIAKIFQHAVYKRVMNTIILVFSKGEDPNYRQVLESPDLLLSEPCCVYSPGQSVVQLKPLLEI